MNNPSIQYLYILTNSLYEQLSIRQINLLIWIKPGLIKIKLLVDCPLMRGHLRPQFIEFIRVGLL
jgi:hypothetical protein